MSPPPLAQVAPYIHPELTVVYWVESIVDIASPTRAELDAGLDLSAAVLAVVGWRVSRSASSHQAYTDDFDVQLEGSATVDDSVLVFKADQTGGDITAVLVEGDTGHVVMLYGGDVAGNPMDVWPARVAAFGRGVDVDGALAAVAVQFVITADPARGVAVPGA